MAATKARRLVRGIAIAGGVLVGLVLLVAAAVAYVFSPSGNDLVRRRALQAINQALAGRIEVDALELDLDRVRLGGVRLFDPTGAEVARLDGAEARWRLRPLFARRVELGLVRVDGPAVVLGLGGDAEALARALAPRTPAPKADEPASTGGSSWALALDRFELHDGRVSMGVTPGAPLAATGIDGLTVTGRGRIALDTLVGEAHVDASARVGLVASPRSPGQVSVTLAVALASQGEGGARAKVELSAGRASLSAEGTVARTPDGGLRAVSLERSRLVAPGAELALSGRITPPSLAIDGTLDASDLRQAIAAALDEPAAAALGVSGRARATFQVAGTFAAPSVRAKADVPALVLPGARVRGLALDADLPDVLRPNRGRVRLDVADLGVANRRIEALALGYRADREQAFALDLAARGDVPLGIGLRGTWIEPGRALFVDGLELRHRDLALVQRGRARVDTRGGALAVEHLDLAGNGQRIAATVRVAGETLRGDVTLGLDLERWPRAFAPAGLPTKQLAGRVDLAASFDGRLPMPNARVRLRAPAVRFGAYAGLGLALDGRVRAGRADGRLVASGLGAQVSSQFDVPLSWPPPARAPVLVELDSETFPLEQLYRIPGVGERLAALPKLAGKLDAHVRLDGPAAHPAFTARVALADAVVDGQRLGSFRVEAADPGGRDGGLTISFIGTGLARRADAQVAGGPSFGTLLRAPDRFGDASAWLGRTIDVSAHVEALPLAPLLRVARADAPGLTPGTVSLDVDVSGPTRALLGKARLSLAGVGFGPVPPTDARVDVRLEADAVKVDATASRTRAGEAGFATLATLHARADVPAATRLEPSAWHNPAFAVQAHVGPLHLTRKDVEAQLADAGDAAPLPPGLEARLEAVVDLSGRLRAPSGEVRVIARDVAAAGRRLGEAFLGVSYRGETPLAVVRLDAAQGGQLELRATTKRKLPFDELVGDVPGQRLVDVPVDVRFDARAFSLAALSGLSRGVRDVEGTLVGRASFEGTVQRPSFAGRITVKGGGATLSELGHFHDAKLDVAATETGLVLHELSARAGRGRLAVSGSATRAGGGGLRLALDAKTNRFPLVAQGRVLGELELDASAKGVVDREGVRIDPLTIDDARVELAGTSPKDIQSLDRPADVIYLRGGRPIDAAERKRLEALAWPKDDPADVSAEPKPAGPRARSLRPPITIALRASRNVWVRAPDANVELGFSEGFRIAIDDEVAVYGEVAVRRGTVSVYGRFDVDRESTVIFSGPADNPRVNLKFEHFNERENVRVWVTVKGPRDRLEIELRSEPSYSQSEIVTLLVTGRLNLRRRGQEPTTTASDQATSLLGGLLASQLQRSVLRHTGIDVLQISPTSIEAGGYLTDDLYVGYLRRLNAMTLRRYENVNAVRVEYEFTPRWSVEGEYGDMRTGSADLIWKIRY